MKLDTKKRVVQTLLVCGITSCSWPIFSAQFLAISGESNQVYLINSTTPDSPILVGDFAEGVGATGVIIADDETFYTFDSGANQVVTMSRRDASILNKLSIDVDLFATRRGFALSPAGILYGVLPGMQLRTVNVSTGVTTLIAPITGASRVEDIAFAPDGTLYAVGSANNNWSSERLYTLDLATAVLTEIGMTGFQDIDILTHASDGFLYGVDTNGGINTPLLKIDPATAIATDVGLTGIVAITGLAEVESQSGADVDGDGDIDDTDLGLAISNFTGPGGSGKTIAQGDVDGDGDVDDTDLGVMISGFTGPLSPPAVPEPASGGAVLLGLAALTRRRRVVCETVASPVLLKIGINSSGR